VGLEQGFTILGHPEGEGALSIDGALTVLANARRGQVRARCAAHRVC